MKRILLYVHYNKYDNLSSHVLYQLEKMRPLFEDILFISNSNLSKSDKDKLEEAELITDFLQRKKGSRTDCFMQQPRSMSCRYLISAGRSC